MIALLATAGSWIARIPNIKWIAGVGAAFFLGLMLGNYHATQNAVRFVAQMTQDRADREQAAVSQALIQRAKQDKERVEAAAAQAREADEKAHETFAAGTDSAKRDVAAARIALAQEAATRKAEQEKSNALLGVNNELASMVRDADGKARAAMEAAIMCGSADTRRVLDEASGARDSGDRALGGDPQAAAAGGIDAGAAASAQLACDELKDGYVNLAEHDRQMRAWVLSFQAWAAEALR